jgi:hypothetical protein
MADSYEFYQRTKSIIKEQAKELFLKEGGTSGAFLVLLPGENDDKPLIFCADYQIMKWDPKNPDNTKMKINVTEAPVSAQGLKMDGLTLIERKLLAKQLQAIVAEINTQDE